MLAFAKGHGTLNDFVLLLDPDDAIALTDDVVRFLCDRRAGIGGDGVLRVVRGRYVPDWDGDGDLWFMDYRNADGSIAEMCGNGIRVFARYLLEEGLVPHGTTRLHIGTRAGVRTAQALADGQIRVWMGHPRVAAAETLVTAGRRSWTASAVDVGNPHAVAVLDDSDDLDAVDLSARPGTPPGRFPKGVNVEFVRVLGPDRVRMRVYERGVGETFSCGTGTVAVAAAVARRLGVSVGAYTVEVPGGTVRVDLRDGQAWLTGPAEVVARGVVRLPGEEGIARPGGRELR